MVREHLKRRVRSWLLTFVLVAIVIGILMLAGINPGDGSLVSTVLGNKWFGLAALVLMAESENWNGWLQGRKDQRIEHALDSAYADLLRREVSAAPAWRASERDDASTS